MLIKPFFYEPAKHLYRLFSEPEYLAWCIQEAKLGNVRRFNEQKTRVHGWDISLPDVASYLSSYKEIFVNRIYEFESLTDQPNILDLGANIGLSVLFFKTLYPQARITAFEADPNIFRYLTNNVHGNGYVDVELINKAIWNKNCILKFYAEGADGGRVAALNDQKLVEVEAMDIKEFMNGRQFEFLKMDIEGAEEIVFPELANFLSRFKYIFLEYHSKIGEKQCLANILQILAEQGFRVNVHNVMADNISFIKTNLSTDFDMQLNIFATKEDGGSIRAQ